MHQDQVNWSSGNVLEQLMSFSFSISFVSSIISFKIVFANEKKNTKK